MPSLLVTMLGFCLVCWKNHWCTKERSRSECSKAVFAKRSSTNQPLFTHRTTASWSTIACSDCCWTTAARQDWLSQVTTIWSCLMSLMLLAGRCRLCNDIISWSLSSYKWPQRFIPMSSEEVLAIRLSCGRSLEMTVRMFRGINLCKQLSYYPNIIPEHSVSSLSLKAVISSQSLHK